MKNNRVLYEFDGFRVDSGQFLLVKQGRPQPITPTVFRILLVLLEKAGDVVTKDELISSIWSDSFVEEGNLNRNVSTLRKALGETPRDHRYIETIPKTGYRFVAPVRPIAYQPANHMFADISAADRMLLAAASVQGFEFDSAILAKSLGARPEDIKARLATISEVHGLIRPMLEEEMMDGNLTVRYCFAHGYRTVYHEALPPARKPPLSSAVAEAPMIYGA